VRQVSQELELAPVWRCVEEGMADWMGPRGDGPVSEKHFANPQRDNCLIKASRTSGGSAANT